MSDVIVYADRRMVSPWVLSVWVTLKEKGIDFEVTHLNLAAGESRTGRYGSRALSQKVPGLEHRGELFSESLAILEYLEEAFPTPRIFSADRVGRTRDREVLSAIRTDFGELRKAMPFEGLLSRGSREQGQPHGPKVEAELEKLLRLHRSRPGGAASAPTIADVEIAAMLQRPLGYGHEIPEPARAYANAIWNRPSVKSWLEAPRPT